VIHIGFSQSDTPTSTNKLDSINGIYIPYDLKDCFKQIDIIMADSTKVEVKNMNEFDFVGNYHFGFGMWMRNNWGLWRGSRLYIYFEKKGLHHPDDMSGCILTSYHRYLNNKNIKLRNQIIEYKNYWGKSTSGFVARTSSDKKYRDLDSALLNADSIIAIELIGYKKIPRKLNNFKNLKELTIEDSPLIELDKVINKIAKIKNIEKLRFFDNQKLEYPNNIGILHNINSLWISGDSITKVPNSITNMGNLNELIINECPLIDFANLFNTLEEIESLKELDISENNITTIPDNIRKLNQLKELWLDGNSLTEISNGIKSLHNLNYLRLFSNNIKSLDLTNNDLINLKNIDLCYNQFNVFPIELSNLKKLERITMWYSEVSIIPKDITRMDKLKFINLTNNNLTEEQKKLLKEALPNTELKL